MKPVLLLSSVAMLLSACDTLNPPKDVSTQKRIGEELRQAAEPRPRQAPAPTTAAPPQAVSNALLPPLRSSAMPKASAKQLEQRFDLVVTDAPISQVLTAIVSDTPYSILLSPKINPPGMHGAAQGEPAAPNALQPGGVSAPAALVRQQELLTVRLKDVTVFEALDSVRELYGYEYQVEGTRIYVRPPELRSKLYQVNYILGQRRGVSDLQVIGGASTGSSSGGGSGGGGSGGSSGGSGGGGGSSSGSSFSAIQASALSTISKSDIWSEVEDSLRTLLGCQISRVQAPKATTSGSSGSSGSGSSGGGSRADVSFVGDALQGERQRGVDGCSEGRAMTVNQMSGTILVRGMPRELRQVESMLRTMQLNIERQVIIEAKIIDVELNTDAQQGINWAAFPNHNLHRASVGLDPNQIVGNGSQIGGTGAVPPGGAQANTSLASLLGASLVGAGASNAFTAGLGIAIQTSQFAALINFLQTQGEVHVLSSPRIATLNNQKAVLKVGAEESFVTSISGGTTTVTNGISNSSLPTLNYQPFFSGIALDVTPQIDENDRITLHVHAMVNSIIERSKVALLTPNAPTVPFAVNSISETDSVVKTLDGMMVVIGGLMTESTTDNRSKIPGAGDVPVAGALFRKNGQASTKRELVILLKPTVIKDESTWAREIAATEGRLSTLSQGTAKP
ncbi:secretin N-terminal domain-containing protein [Roseateles violae]|uniref:Secretin N-terminal domain-containing protein n=1 Tax=Roseateles violae TaxID=3058042 RepID=A0ABT8DTS7_9BURK|nr:secretin N-terminal domain-containing protein [Pelomonas sp. PFR6]MDN3921695.1 secretin N-terminal domain-containing protein [Pelomonas sp. PFR6]